VGFFDNGTADVPLILRWNGQTWAQVASPHPGTFGALDAVAATSASNAWAVGTFFNGTADQGFILHWNGTKWAQVAIPNPGGPTRDTFLNGVAAGAGSGKAWAVGAYNNGTTDKTLILTWTGTKWAQQASPTPGSSALDSVATTAADNTWAVGAYKNSTIVASLILHWNGTKWAQVGSPNPSPTSNFLFAVAASSASNAWAVGRFTDDSGPTTVDKTFAIHCC